MTDLGLDQEKYEVSPEVLIPMVTYKISSVSKNSSLQMPNPTNFFYFTALYFPPWNLYSTEIYIWVSLINIRILSQSSKWCLSYLTFFSFNTNKAFKRPFTSLLELPIFRVWASFKLLSFQNFPVETWLWTSPAREESGADLEMYSLRHVL